MSSTTIFPGGTGCGHSKPYLYHSRDLSCSSATAQGVVVKQLPQDAPQLVQAAINKSYRTWLKHTGLKTVGKCVVLLFPTWMLNSWCGKYQNAT